MKKLKKLTALIFSAVLLLNICIPASAEQIRVTDSFTHQDTGSGTKLSVAMPDAFAVETIVNARSLGLEESYGTIVDIDCDKNGNCFILSEDGIIVEFDRQFKFVKYHEPVDNSGKPYDFYGAKGIYVNDGEIYIADTMNSRVVCFKDNKALKEIVMPESALIPSDFVFSPTKVEKDSKGYLYVISEGSYYGAVMYDPDGEFAGFYGANTVSAGVLSTIGYIWDTLTSNDTKRAKKVKTLPFQFVDICIDNKDFVYTCTGLTSDTNSTGQIRMLSPGGSNILYRRQHNGSRVGSSSFVFGETDYAKRLNKKIDQDFESIKVDENGFIYALDLTYGLIYVYDTDCNLLTAFAGGRGNGKQNGVFPSPVALSLYGNRVYVADSLENSVTVFSMTDFGNDLFSAQKKTLESKYSESEELWRKVLKKDSHNQLALRGMAKVCYIKGDYQKALEYSEEGLDYVIYGQALKMVQDEFINKNFTWLFLGAIAVIALIIVLIIYKKKKQIRLIKNGKLKMFFNGFLHPFDAYNAVRYKNMGSLKIALVMTVLYFVSSVLTVLCCNFRYTSFDTTTFSSTFQLVKSVGLIILWSLANWGVSVLLQGIGKFKHVFIVTAYSVLPIIIYNFISIPVSYLITSPTSTLMDGMSLVAMFWTGIVLTIGLMIIHNFTFPRFLASVAIGLFFMLLIILIVFIFGILITQLWGFVVTIFMEVIYR